MKACMTVSRWVPLYNQSPWSWVFLSNKLRKTVGHVTEIPPWCLQLLRPVMLPCWKFTPALQDQMSGHREECVTHIIPRDAHFARRATYARMSSTSLFLITRSSFPAGWGASCLADLQSLFLVGWKSKPVCWPLPPSGLSPPRCALKPSKQSTINKGGVLYRRGNK